MYQDIVIYYFSATRNTFRAMSEMASVFRERLPDSDITIIPIDENRYYGWDPDLTGFALPVAEGTFLPFIWEFLEQLPPVKISKAFVLDTHHGSPAVLNPMYHLLKNKGYDPVASCEIIMPGNISSMPVNDVFHSAAIESALIKARRFAVDILDGKASYKRDHIGSDIPALIQRYTGIPLRTKKLFTTLQINGERCSRCGICADLCPVKCIRPGFSRYVIDEDKCQLCFRCLAHCPDNAIELNGERLCSANGS
jgi:NAD-dependent dihydropyrimidine dehydrogenase PreA subunit